MTIRLSGLQIAGGVVVDGDGVEHSSVLAVLLDLE
jgi:hypothetical protein